MERETPAYHPSRGHSPKNNGRFYSNAKAPGADFPWGVGGKIEGPPGVPFFLRRQAPDKRTRERVDEIRHHGVGPIKAAV
jgi:hypothetical protein